MPSRRRRFSVQRDIAGKTVRNPNKSSNASQPCCKTSQSQPEPEKPGKRLKNSDNVPKPGKAPQTNPITTPLESKETASNPSLTNTIVNKKSSRDKHVTASSSNIDLYAMLNMIEVETDSVREIQEFDQKRETKQAETRRDKHPRQHQHRVKVRSPKRRMNVAGCVKVADNVVSVGTDIIDWDRESDEYMIMTESNTETILSAVISNDRREDRESSHSLDDMCRICHGGEAPSLGLGHLISACSCRGTVGRVHVRCLERWLTESGKSRCELCGTRYATRRVHRYGVPRSLIMWILSHNAKQLMVDSLGIMLMSPLAVLAAWLSGRTLAGLMTQDSHITPWPLASTFVLACMTLVCYYCWIVSAATRHALGWWIWYRSQYEVRLQLEGNEE